MNTAHLDTWEDARKGALNIVCHSKLVSFLRLTAVQSSRSKQQENGKTHAKERYKLNVCCWNVRTLLELSSSNRPERRTALITKELRRLNVDVAALSETRLSGEDNLLEKSSGYTIFWVGKPAGVKREGGVGFAIKSALVDKMERPSGISDRIMKLRIPLSCGRYLSLLSVYAPTLQSSEEITRTFYEALRETITSIPKDDKLILLGDFNARVGTDWETWDSLGRYGIGKINSNGLKLLELCSELNLVICNTFFHQKKIHKTTWTHPRSKQGHLLDYIITRKRDLADVCNVRVLRSAECDTDHKMVRGKFKCRIRKKIRFEGVKIPKSINVSKLKDPVIRETVSAKLDSLVFDGTWKNFKDQVYSTGLEELGLKQKQHKDWFDDNDTNINALLQEKQRLHGILLNSSPRNKTSAEKAYKDHKAILQRELRRMKNQWWSNMSYEVQRASDSKDSKTLYGLLNQVFGPSSSPTVPLKSKDNTTLIKDPNKILGRWHEHFKDLFFNPSEVDNDAIDSLPQAEIRHHLDRLPTFEEVELAAKQLNSGKASVEVPVELLQTGSKNVLHAIHDSFVNSWGGIPIPQDWINGILVSIFKGKGEKSVCDNYRGITLLESVGKVLARLLLNRLTEDICPTVIPESQSGFRSGRGTVDMIFAVRQVQEKCIEQQMSLYQVFVDLTKAFDTVNRNVLWKILEKIGCPPKFVHMFKELHRNMKARVNFNGQLSDELAVDNGVKQGDIPAPTLFSIFFAVLLSYAFQDCDNGILLKFRTTGKVFNLRRFNAKTKTFETLVRELLYADDADFLAHSEEDMQYIMDRFSHACTVFGLRISLKKTKVMFTPAPGEPYIEPNITVYGTRLDVVDTFVYLGSTTSRNGSLDAEIYSRINKGAVAFGKLEKRVWADREITINTKLDIYKSCVLTVILYAAETWTTFRKHIKMLEHFHLKCLRRILNIKWQTFTPDTAVLEKAQCSNIESLIVASQMRWAGHLVRMEDTRLPKQLFYGELVNGKRPRWKPRKRFKDCLKFNLKELSIDDEVWEETALNRGDWRKAVKDGCKSLEYNRIEHAKLKRELRKGCADNVPPDSMRWTCETCERVLLSKAGYVNHLKAHQNTPIHRHVLAQPGITTCVICNKVCKSTAGLKRHMKVHKDVLKQPDPINTIETSFVCHMCYRPCKSSAGLRSHLRSHGRMEETNNN